MDNALLLYEQLFTVKGFEVMLISEIVDRIKLHGNGIIPDHSFLMRSAPLSVIVSSSHIRRILA